MKLLYYALLLCCGTRLYSLYQMSPLLTDNGEIVHNQTAEQNQYQEIEADALHNHTQQNQYPDHQPECPCPCGETLSDQGAFNEHIENNHKNQHGQYACPSCQETFGSYYYFKTHIAEDHVFLCKCLRLFNEKRELFEHINNSHKTADGNYFCPAFECIYVTPRKDKCMLSKHMAICNQPAAQNTLHNNFSRRFLCKCSQSFSNKLLLDRHINTSHKNAITNNYSCPACDTIIKGDVFNIKKHMNRCKAQMPITQPNLIPQDELARLAQMLNQSLENAHVAPAQTGNQNNTTATTTTTTTRQFIDLTDTRFDCTCGNQYPTSTDLDTHIIESHVYMHGNREAYICDRCRYAARTFLLFKNHLHEACQTRN